MVINNVFSLRDHLNKQASFFIFLKNIIGFFFCKGKLLNISKLIWCFVVRLLLFVSFVYTFIQIGLIWIRLFCIFAYLKLSIFYSRHVLCHAPLFLYYKDWIQGCSNVQWVSETIISVNRLLAFICKANQ